MDAALEISARLQALLVKTADHQRPATAEPFRMDLLPDTLVQHILSYLTAANDVAVASCVSKKWKDFISFRHRLRFYRTLFNKLDSTASSDEIVGKMVSSMVQLEELHVYWPFTTSSLVSWLAAMGNSLRKLSLLIYNFDEEDTMGKLDCIQSASSLEALTLVFFKMDNSPNWDIFPNLKNLEMLEAIVTGSALSGVLRACPYLTSLKCALGGEEDVFVSIDLKHLEKCRLEFYESGDNSVSLACPKLISLELRGCSWIRMSEAKSLRDLLIGNDSGRVYMVDFGKLEALESLDLQGVIWCWDTLNKMFQLASEVKHLSVNIVLTGDLDKPVFFRGIDLVEFFNCHPKLKRFNINGGMFDALCRENSLENRMDLLPDTIVRHILSYLTDAHDVALASCVSKKWKDFISAKHKLRFPRAILGKLDSIASTDEIVGKMVSSMVQLEELLVYWPFTATSLASWLAATGNSLRELSLLINNFYEEEIMEKLDYIQSASNLEALKLWYFKMDKTPKWDVFPNLRNLEIVEANVTGSAFSNVLRACPYLTSLKCALGREEKVSVSIDLKHLEKCRLDFYKSGDNSVSLACPKLTALQLRGCSSIRMSETQSLQDLLICSASGRVYMLDFGKLVALESLDLQGAIWCWDALNKMFQLASEVKRLSVNIAFTGDLNEPVYFHEIDLVEFFNCHPNLQSFNMSGAMFHALCQENSLNNVDSSFSIPCLEEVIIIVGAHLTAEQALNTLESVLKYSPRLKKMTVKVVSLMKVPRSAFDKLFKAVCKFEEKNSKVVTVESGGR